MDTGKNKKNTRSGDKPKKDAADLIVNVAGDDFVANDVNTADAHDDNAAKGSAGRADSASNSSAGRADNADNKSIDRVDNTDNDDVDHAVGAVNGNNRRADNTVNGSNSYADNANNSNNDINSSNANNISNDNNVNNDINENNGSNGYNGGKSLKAAFTEYLEQKKTSRPSLKSKTGSIIEFTQPPYDEDAFSLSPGDAHEHDNRKSTGSFIEVAGANGKTGIIDGFGNTGKVNASDDGYLTPSGFTEAKGNNGAFLRGDVRGAEHSADIDGFDDVIKPNDNKYNRDNYQNKYKNDIDGGIRYKNDDARSGDGFQEDYGNGDDYDASSGGGAYESEYAGDYNRASDGEYAGDYDRASDNEYSGDYDDASDGDYGDVSGYDADSGDESSGYDDESDYDDDADEYDSRWREWTPLEIVYTIFRYLFLAIKWVLVYMGRFVLTVLKTAVIIVLVVAFGVLGAGVGAIYGYLQNVEPITDISLEMKIQTSYIYDADGNQIARLTGSENINRQLVRYNEISPYLPKALIAIEDKRFESHNGVDPKRIISAGLQFILGGSDAHGASTITQQLVKNVTGKKDETLERKVQEWYLAIELEKTMEKWKILELYLNVVYFGNSCYGVSSASRTYFGKPVGDLNLAESAFIVGVTNSPGTYNPFSETGYNNAMKRQAIILNEMLSQGMISDEEYDEAIKAPIRIIPKAVTTAVASKPNSYFVDYVIEEVKNDLMTEKGMTAEMALAQIYNYGLRIYTTQSPSIQSALDSVFNDPQYFPDINPDAQKNNELPQGAMVILDPNTARIIAMAGGYGEKLADRTFNRATQALRQPGSSIKPIAVYGPALDQHVITLASISDDTPVHLDPNNPERIYPSNSSNDFRGLTSIRNAIRRSVNVISAKTWLTIPDTSHSYLDKVGINRDNESQVALSLGGLHKGVTPLEMAAAYVPFVNRGMYYEPTTYTKVLDSNGRVLLDKTVRLPTIVYSEQTAYLVTSALEDVLKSGGTGTQASLFDGMMPAAGKTGTTNDNADRWFVGYTPYYVASTWYGYDNRIKKITLTQDELNNAMIVWRTVMEKIHEGLVPKEFAIPDQIVTANVCAYSGKTPTALCRNDPRGNAIRTEIFAKGTEPLESDLCNVHISYRICTAGSEAIGASVEAGPYCPADVVETRVAIKREFPFIPEQGDPYPTDWTYEYSPLPECPYHTEFGIAPEYAPEPEEEEESEDGNPDGQPDNGGQGEGGQNEANPDSGDGVVTNPAIRPLRTPRPGRNIPVTDVTVPSTEQDNTPNPPPPDNAG